MIQLVSAENDDAAFLSLAQRIANGAVAALHVREVFLVHVDNWFDHKWLGWRSTWRHREVQKLRVPLFNPNRIRSEKHFVWDLDTSTWKSVGLAKPLHVRQSCRPGFAHPLERYSTCAAFIWYSGSTTTNTLGSLMLYLSGAEGYSWYASFKKDDRWTIADELRITRRELLSFEERGVQMELAEA